MRQLSWIIPLLIVLSLGWQSVRLNPPQIRKGLTPHPSPDLPAHGDHVSEVDPISPALAAARKGHGLTLSFEERQKVLLLEPSNLLGDRFKIALGSHHGAASLARPEIFTGWAVDPSGASAPMQATLSVLGDHALGTWITSEGTTWQFQWNQDSPVVTLTELLSPVVESTLEGTTCRIREVGDSRRPPRVLQGELKIAAQGGLEPATAEPTKYVDVISPSEAYALSLKSLNLMLVLDQSASGPNESESLAIVASQWLAAAANVATIYENQLGIRLQLQELILLPDDPAFTDIPSSSALTDFRQWINNERPRTEYPWQAAFKIGAGLRAQDLGFAFVASLGLSDSVGVIRPNSGWGTLAHELGHTLGSDHTSGGLMNAQANDGGNRDFFTEVTTTVGRTAAWQIYDHSKDLLSGPATLRHPEEIPFAKNDFRVIAPASPYVFDPRANDLREVPFGSPNGVLSIDSVGTLRPFGAGTVTHDGTRLTFHPNETYAGPVWFSYTLRGSLGNDGQGWLHKGDVNLLVNDQRPIETLNLAPGEARTFSAASGFGSITQPNQATVHRLIADDRLLIRANANAAGTDSFTIGSRTFTINYVETQLSTRPDHYWHAPNAGTLAMRPLANDIASVGSHGSSLSLGLEGEQLPDFPEKLRLTSATNLSPDKGELIVVTAPSVEDGLASEIPNGELHFTPEPDAQGTVSINYSVESPSGETATETIKIHLTGATRVLLSAGANASYLIPRTPNDAPDWFSLAFNGATWNSGKIPIGYEDGRGYEDVIQTEVGSQMVNVNSSIYVRIPFDVASVDDVTQLQLRMRMDDGFIAYLNGKEVLRDNTPDNVGWNSSADLSREANAFVAFDLTEARSLLRPGSNLLAIHGMNALPDSSDFLLMPELVSLTLPRIARISSPATESVSVSARTGILFQHEILATDLPITEPIVLHWQIIEAPSSSRIQPQALPNGDFPVTFPSLGTYRIRLTATDASGLQTHDERTIRVGEARSYDQLADTITLSEDQTISELSTSLTASIASDTPWITPEARWTTLSGPATALAEDAAALTTQVSFPRPGRYTLRFEATHSDLTLFQDSTIDVLTKEQILVGEETSSRFTFLTAETETPSWPLPGFDDSQWHQGGQGLGYDVVGDFQPYIDTNIQNEMRFLHTSLFTRYAFQLDNAGSIHDLQLFLRLDDGGVVYLNGQEVYRQNAPLYDLSSESTALRTASESDFATPQAIDLTEFRNTLQQGVNVLAIQGLNLATSSSDFLVEPTLVAQLGEGNGLPAGKSLHEMLKEALGSLPPSLRLDAQQLSVEFHELRQLNDLGGRTSLETSQDLKHWTPWNATRRVESGSLDDYIRVTLSGPRPESDRYLRVKVSF